MIVHDRARAALAHSRPPSLGWFARLGRRPEAHKLKAFATVEGTTISGYAYFTPGGRAQQADVTVTGPGAVEVLKTAVDAEGNFHFVAKQRVDYTITVDGGDRSHRQLRHPCRRPAGDLAGAGGGQASPARRADPDRGRYCAAGERWPTPLTTRRPPPSPRRSTRRFRAMIRESVAARSQSSARATRRLPRGRSPGATSSAGSATSSASAASPMAS